MTRGSKNSVRGFKMTLFKQTKMLFENKAFIQQWVITKACYVFRAMLNTSCEKRPDCFKYLMSTRDMSKHARLFYAQQFLYKETNCAHSRERFPQLTLMVSIETIINKQTHQNIHFPGKVPICKDQQIDYFLLINNVNDFEKMSVAFLNNNNLFPQH